MLPIVVGKYSIDTQCRTVFRLLDMALYDLFAARAFLAAAFSLNRGTQQI
jgi:hypothetical protein